MAHNADIAATARALPGVTPHPAVKPRSPKARAGHARRLSPSRIPVRPKVDAALPDSVQSAIDSARAGGQPLETATRDRLAPAFGDSLEQVRVHTDGRAATLARSVAARAFTVGNDIFFAAGQYRPGSSAGDELIAHEATHTLQQRGAPTGEPLGVSDPGDPLEREASAFAAEARAVRASPAAGPSGSPRRSPDAPRLRHGGRRVLQRAIGLEIEVPVPVDQLSPADVNTMRAEEAAATTPGVASGVALLHRVHAAGIMDIKGPVPYKQVIKPETTAPTGFRAETDHDDRVRTPGKLNFPITENDTIMELVMDPPADTEAQFDTAVTNMLTFVAQVDTATNNLTRRAVNPYGGGAAVGVGPMDYPPVIAPRRPQHNWDGSIQVNIGIDLREYHSLLKWYAESGYASPQRAPSGHRAVFRSARDDIRRAVDVARDITDKLEGGRIAPRGRSLTSVQRQQAGNLRGVRGWITHMALYLLRGAIPAGVLAGTSKNLAPALLKSPPQVASLYGMTSAEIALFNNHTQGIVDAILRSVGRGGEVSTPLANLAIFPVFPNDGGADVNAPPGSPNVPLTADVLTNLGAGGGGSGVVPLAGGPIANAPGVGPVRTGAVVSGLPAVPLGPGANPGFPRGGVVTEFRLLPGYHQPSEWLELGRSFLRAATERNRRSGVRP